MLDALNVPPERFSRRSRGGRRSRRPVPPAPLLPPRATADGTHRRLQEAALVLFSQRGFAGVSIRDLAEAAGIATSSMYGHVTAKEDLLTELMLVGHEEHHDRLRTALLSSAPDPRAQMNALVHAHVTMHATYPLLARLCNRELHALSTSSAARVAPVRQQSERLFFDVVSRGMADGTFTVAEPWLAVAAIGGMGIRVAEWFPLQTEYTVEQVAEHYTIYALKILSR
jgi:AcrR family transcriptional regulator